MKGVVLLSTRHLLANPGLATILVLCLAVTAFVPAATAVLTTRYEQALVARSASTPLVAGARGSRFDLVLAALYARPSGIEPVTRALYDELRTDPALLAIPLHVGHTAQGVPVVGTTLDYFDWRGLTPRDGRAPAVLGEAILGHRAARRLDAGPDAAIFSDQPALYDLAKPSAIRLRVVGVLAPTGTPDDDVVFVDVKTAWLMDGRLHGHRAAADIDDAALLIGRTDEHVAVSGALIEHNAVTRENAAAFHLHGDPDRLPLTAVIIDPTTPKAGTLVKSRINAAGVVQVVSPREIVDELLEFVFRVKAALDTLSVVLAVCTGVLGGLVVVLSLRLRAPEISTLHRMGCGRHTVALLCASEVALILVAGLTLAGLGVAATAALAPDLIQQAIGDTS